MDTGRRDTFSFQGLLSHSSQTTTALDAKMADETVHKKRRKLFLA